jgi:hypothetical protein
MIGKYSFGRITIDGRLYDADVLIYPDRIDGHWCRKEGHRLQLADLEAVKERHPSVVVVGTGYLEGCASIRRCPTGRLRDTQNVVAALHLTC